MNEYFSCLIVGIFAELYLYYEYEQSRYFIGRSATLLFVPMAVVGVIILVNLVTGGV